MRLDDMILVSVDDHVVEPADIWTRRVPTRYRDQVPRLVMQDDGTESWEYLGEFATNVGLNAVVGRPREDYGLDALAIADMRKGCYDVHERVRDMSANGVLGSLCFPSWPGFAGTKFLRTPDKQMALSLLRVYNEWHIEDWCGAYPGRFIPLGLVPIWDPQLMASEVHRLAGRGCHAVTFSENPSCLGLPSLHSDHWNPFWEACEETQTVVCMHIGSSSKFIVTSEDAPFSVVNTLSGLNLMQAAADLIWSPVFRRFPLFKVALSEGGIGWIPYFLDRIDYHYEHHKMWTGQDFGDKLPSQVFRERIITCFFSDPAGVKMRHDIGIDTITWECDYPHSDSTWPTSPEQLWVSLNGVSAQDINKMTFENACRVFQFDPFAYRTRDQCSVAALRSEASDVYVGYHEATKRTRKIAPVASSVLRNSAQ